MAEILFKGNPVNTAGSLPAVGGPAPTFSLIKTDLTEISSKDLQGKRYVLNIFPSVDTGVCAASVRAFNEAAASLDNTVVINVSKDLPFAHKRFCGAEGIDRVESCSDYRNPEFCNAYPVTMTTGALAGLMSRAVVVVDENGSIIYTEQVPEITQEPNYDAALEALK